MLNLSRRRKIGIGFLAVGLVVCLYFIGTTEVVKACENQADAAHEAQPAKEGVSRSLVFISRRCWGAFLSEDDKPLVVLATIGLFFVTTGLAFYTFKLWRTTGEMIKKADTAATNQLRTMEGQLEAMQGQESLLRESVAVAGKSADAAEKAATAATKSANVADTALTSLERPYVFVTVPDQELFEEQAAEDRGVASRSAPPLKLRADSAIYFELRNYGRTPAIIKELKSRIQLINTVVPSQNWAELNQTIHATVGTAIPANGEMTKRIRHPLPPHIAANLRDIQYGLDRATLFLTVYVRYEEVFRDESHTTETPFALTLDPTSFIEVTDQYGAGPNKHT